MEKSNCDPEIRQGMQESARDLAEQFSPKKWITRLGRRLAYLPAEPPIDSDEMWHEQAAGGMDKRSLNRVPRKRTISRTRWIGGSRTPRACPWRLAGVARQA